MFFLKKIYLSLFSTSFFAKYLHVVEDGSGQGHLYHTDTFLVFFFFSLEIEGGIMYRSLYN